ncbi:MAG: hypothetical protein Q4C71_00285 [Microbacteriaceae bacterium]|nr:hypothetical protein [Microbacteriaceae bacterium]
MSFFKNKRNVVVASAIAASLVAAPAFVAVSGAIAAPADCVVEGKQGDELKAALATCEAELKKFNETKVLSKHGKENVASAPLLELRKAEETYIKGKNDAAKGAAEAAATKVNDANTKFEADKKAAKDELEKLGAAKDAYQAELAALGNVLANQGKIAQDGSGNVQDPMYDDYFNKATAAVKTQEALDAKKADIAAKEAKLAADTAAVEKPLQDATNAYALASAAYDAVEASQDEDFKAKQKPRAKEAKDKAYADMTAKAQAAQDAKPELQKQEDDLNKAKGELPAVEKAATDAKKARDDAYAANPALISAYVDYAEARVAFTEAGGTAEQANKVQAAGAKALASEEALETAKQEKVAADAAATVAQAKWEQARKNTLGAEKTKAELELNIAKAKAALNPSDDEAKKKIEALEKELAEVKQNRDDFKAGQAIANNELIRAIKYIDKLREDHYNLDVKNAEQEQQIAALEAERDNYKAEFEKAFGEVQRTYQAIADRDKSLDAFEAALNQANEKIVGLEAGATEYIKKYDELQKFAASQAAAADKLIADLNKQIEELKKKQGQGNTSNSAEVEELKKKLADAETAKLNLQKQLDVFKLEAEQSKAMIAELKDKLKVAEGALAVATVNANNDAAKIAELTAQIATLTAERDAAKAEVERLTKELAAAKAQNVKDAARIAELEKQLAEAQQKLAECEAKLKDAQNKAPEAPNKDDAPQAPKDKDKAPAEGEKKGKEGKAGELENTGANATGLLAAGAVLSAIGAAGLLASRRRRAA